jgi:hypothetical protein
MKESLEHLGDSLERAAARDLDRTCAHRRVPRRLLVTIAVVLVAGTGIAIGATQLISNESVATSMPAGAKWLEGTDPSCSTVKEGVEYHCVLAKHPSDAISDWLGTVNETVDATKHVNGGCRSLSHDGLEWQCYIGQKAVDEKIIGQDFLGEYAPTPGVG